jgi:hypothetical protein
VSRNNNKILVPIMSDAAQRFMAFEGLVQWTAATIEQGRRITEATAKQNAALQGREDARLLSAQVRTEHHYFAICANKVLEHRDWVLQMGLCAGVDFTPLDQFSSVDIRDLRNMREHVVDYFKGIGIEKTRWVIETPEFKADASSSVGTLIGGRLDWKLFVIAAEKLLPSLLAEPIPHP